MSTLPNIPEIVVVTDRCACGRERLSLRRPVERDEWTHGADECRPHQHPATFSCPSCREQYVITGDDPAATLAEWGTCPDCFPISRGAAGGRATGSDAGPSAPGSRSARPAGAPVVVPATQDSGADRAHIANLRGYVPHLPLWSGWSAPERLLRLFPSAPAWVRRRTAVG